VFWPGCFLHGKKEKLRSWTVASPGTEQDWVRESPHKIVGKVEVFPTQAGMSRPQCLNESPSKKEGKLQTRQPCQRQHDRLNESPSKKEGKSLRAVEWLPEHARLNESPSEKEGKSAHIRCFIQHCHHRPQ